MQHCKESTATHLLYGALERRTREPTEKAFDCLACIIVRFTLQAFAHTGACTCLPLLMLTHLIQHRTRITRACACDAVSDGLACACDAVSDVPQASRIALQDAIVDAARPSTSARPYSTSHAVTAADCVEHCYRKLLLTVNTNAPPPPTLRTALSCIISSIDFSACSSAADLVR